MSFRWITKQYSDSLCVCSQRWLPLKCLLWWRRHTLRSAPRPSRLSQTLWTSCSVQAAGKQAGKARRLLLKQRIGGWRDRWGRHHWLVFPYWVIFDYNIAVIAVNELSWFIRVQNLNPKHPFLTWQVYNFISNITCFNWLGVLIVEHEVRKTLSHKELFHAVNLRKMKKL